MPSDNKGKWSIALLAIVVGMALAFLISDLRAEEVAVPKLIGRVNDYASALSPDQRTKLEAQLKELESFPNKPQVAVLIVNTTGDDGIDAFKNKVFQAWKLGNAQTDNGLLTVLAVRDRKIGTEVGYGNEPYFTDGRMAQIRTQIMNPYLKKAEWYNALSAETAEFKKIFAANPQEVVEKSKSSKSSSSGFGLMFLFFALLCVGGVALFIRSQRERRSSRYDRTDYRTSDYTTSDYTSPVRPQPSGSYSNPYGNHTSRPSPFDTDPSPTPSAFREKDHTVRDSALGGFAGGIAGSVIGNEISRRRRRDEDDDDTPSRSSSSYSSDSSSSSGSSWSSSDSSSSSSSSSDSGSSYSGDGGSSGGGGDSGGF